MDKIRKIVRDPDRVEEELHIVRELPVEHLHEVMEKDVRHTFMTVEETLLDMKGTLDYLKEGMEVLLGK